MIKRHEDFRLPCSQLTTQPADTLRQARGRFLRQRRRRRYSACPRLVPLPHARRTAAASTPASCFCSNRAPRKTGPASGRCSSIHCRHSARACITYCCPSAIVRLPRRLNGRRRYRAADPLPTTSASGRLQRSDLRDSKGALWPRVYGRHSVLRRMSRVTGRNALPRRYDSLRSTVCDDTGGWSYRPRQRRPMIGADQLQAQRGTAFVAERYRSHFVHPGT